MCTHFEDVFQQAHQSNAMTLHSNRLGVNRFTEYLNEWLLQIFIINEISKYDKGNGGSMYPRLQLSLYLLAYVIHSEHHVVLKSTLPLINYTAVEFSQASHAFFSGLLGVAVGPRPFQRSYIGRAASIEDVVHRQPTSKKSNMFAKVQRLHALSN